MVFGIGEKGMSVLRLFEHFAECYLLFYPIEYVRWFGKEFNTHRRQIEIEFIQDGCLVFGECHLKGILKTDLLGFTL